MRVDFRRSQRAVSQYFLDVPDIHVLFEEHGGESVAEHMRRNSVADTEGFGKLPDRSARRLGTQTLAESVEKQGTRNIVIMGVYFAGFFSSR